MLNAAHDLIRTHSSTASSPSPISTVVEAGRCLAATSRRVDASLLRDHLAGALSCWWASRYQRAGDHWPAMHGLGPIDCEPTAVRDACLAQARAIASEFPTSRRSGRIHASRGAWAAYLVHHLVQASYHAHRLGQP